MTVKIAIFADEKGWHTRELLREFKVRGLNSRCVDLANCFIETKKENSVLSIPGFLNDLPKFAFVRGIASGTLEQITKRLAILHLLSTQGVKVVNKATAIERSVDKGVTSYLLKRNNIPTPNFWVGESSCIAKKIILKSHSKGKSVVLKPILGSQGQGLFLFDKDNKEAISNLSDEMAKGGVFYLQEFVTSSEKDQSYDFRVLVIKKKAIAAMKRTGSNWIHNRALGAKCEKVNLTKNLKRLSEKAAKVLDLDIAGVDLIPDMSTSEEFQVLEVNAVPAWRGIQSISNFNITKKILDILLLKENFDSTKKFL